MTKKKYLISGATGFIGKYIVRELDAELFDSIGRGHNNSIIFDLAQTELPLTFENKYEYLIIASGHAHVLQDDARQLHLHHCINFKGTQKLVESAYHSCLKGVVFISTVAVYGEKMTYPFKESDELLGDSPYAKSKIAAERYLMDWSVKTRVPVLVLRIPLVAGQDPPGNLGAMIEAIRKKRYFSVGKGRAKRSMVLAEDLAKFIIEMSGHHGIYNLSDGHHPSYREMERCIAQQLNTHLPNELPFLLARILARMGDVLSILPINTSRLKKLTQNLIIDDSKARTELGWQPREVLKNLKVQ
jgi:nucleoside-diphosphate-sugar epimerase